MVTVVDGQLYASSASPSFQAVFSVGTGLPTTAGATTTLLANTGGSPFGFAILDRDPAVAGLDTIYVADDRATASGGGLQKWTSNGTAWTLATTFASGLTAGAYHVVTESAPQGVRVYVTTGETPNRLGTFLDDGVDTNPTFVPLATAQPNTVFHGLAFPPHP